MQIVGELLEGMQLLEIGSEASNLDAVAIVRALNYQLKKNKDRTFTISEELSCV